MTETTLGLVPADTLSASEVALPTEPSPLLVEDAASDTSVSSPTAHASASDEQTSETSWSDYPDDQASNKSNRDSEPAAAHRVRDLKTYLPELFSENILAKALRTSTGALVDSSSFVGPSLVPVGYPETVYKHGPEAGRYEYREPDFWTCGYFPGHLWALKERLVRYPQHSLVNTDTLVEGHAERESWLRHHLHQSLAHNCSVWTENIYGMASRTDTHDLGFIIMPALRREWELTGNPRSIDAIIQAAHSLASRYIPAAGVIRSWDLLLKKEIQVTDTTENAIIIIDSLCNLDLLYYAAAHGGLAEAELANVATTHARSLIQSHLRPESATTRSKRGYRGQLYSTCHVANIDPRNGDLKWRWTAQGYANDSTWSRGQSWAVFGYAQTYQFTKDPLFLEIACGVAEYFLYRLDTAEQCCEVTCTDEKTGTTKQIGRYVPLWDFDAPTDDPQDMPPRDSSAGLIAANGLVILAQSLAARGDYSLSKRFLEASYRIVRDTLDLSLSEEQARFSTTQSDATRLQVENVVEGRTFDAVLKHGTANNNEHARRRLADHGLVYGDYYLVEYGNRLLQMGLV